MSPFRHVVAAAEHPRHVAARHPLQDRLGRRRRRELGERGAGRHVGVGGVQRRQAAGRTRRHHDGRTAETGRGGGDDDGDGRQRARTVGRRQRHQRLSRVEQRRGDANVSGSSARARRELGASSARARRELGGSSAGARRELGGSSAGARRELGGSSAGARRELGGSSAGARRELGGSSAGARRGLGGSSAGARRGLVGDSSIVVQFLRQESDCEYRTDTGSDTERQDGRDEWPADRQRDWTKAASMCRFLLGSFQVLISVGLGSYVLCGPISLGLWLYVPCVY